jgi:hypothetical protein
MSLDEICPHKMMALGLEERNTFWGTVVQAFTSRQLSEPDDKIHALTGVANVFSDIWQDISVFGLLKSCLVQQLGWQVQPIDLRVRKLRSSRAPTWSWMSLDCPISCTAGSFLPDAEVEAKSLAGISKELIVTGNLIPYSMYLDYLGEDCGPPSTHVDVYNELWTTAEKESAKFFLFLGTETTVGVALSIVLLFLADLGNDYFKRLGVSFITLPTKPSERSKRVGMRRKITLI